MWNKKNVQQPREPQRAPTRDELMKQLQDAAIDLKQARAYTKSYKQLYISAKRYLRDARKQIDNLQAEQLTDYIAKQYADYCDVYQSAAIDEQNGANVNADPRILKRNPPQQLGNLRGLYFSNFQVKPRNITYDEYNLLHRQNIKLKDEVTRLSYAKSQSDVKISELLAQMTNYQDGLLKTENLRLKQQMCEQEDEIKTQKRYLRRYLASIQELYTRIHALEEDKTKAIFDGYQELSCYQSIYRDIERYLVESQQNFAALQEEAEIRIQATYHINQEVKCRLIESETHVAQMEQEMAILTRENAQLREVIEQLSADAQKQHSFITACHSELYNTPRRTGNTIAAFKNFDLERIIQAAKDFDPERLKQLIEQCSFAGRECIARFDEIWSDQLREHIENVWNAPAEVMLFVFGGGRVTDGCEGYLYYDL